MLNRMLEMLLKEYGYKGDPKYISNKEIEDFFREHSGEINWRGFTAIKKYFLQDPGVPRYAFTKLEDHFREKSQAGHQQKTGIGSPLRLTPHDLRHCFATHLMENGVSIRYIQSLPGHKNVSTTAIYTKVSRPELRQIKSPL